MLHSLGVAIALVLVLGVSMQWFAWRFRLPAIALLTVCGLLVGPVFGLLDPVHEFGGGLQTVISLSVAVILFVGGLNLRFHELTHAASGVRRLVYLGVPLGFALYSLATHYVGGLSWPVALVFGAIIVVTGPTVILPLLRQTALRRRIASYLKWEAIINDPIGALLAVLVFEYFLYSGSGWFSWQVVWDLGRAVLAAGVFGGLAAFVLGEVFRRDLAAEYLKYPLTLATVIAVFVASNLVQDEAGLLAVTVMGIALGNMGLASIEELRRFKEYISTLLIAVVFILLTASLDPAALEHLHWDGALLIVVIMVVVRPLVVLLATFRSHMRWRERLLLGWIAPRGIVAAAVAGVFAPRLMQAGYADAELLVPLMFALIFVTVVLHGSTLGWLARALGLAAAQRNRLLIVGASPWSSEFARTLHEAGVHVLVVDNSWHRLRVPRLAGIPVYYGEILSDSASEALELNDVGTLLAATSNDAYNAHVCTAFSSFLGQNHVFQLPMYTASGDARRYSRGLRGHLAFGENAQYEELWRWFMQGWTFQKTRLSESYTYEKYLADSTEGALQLITVDADEALHIHSLKMPYQPKEGDTVIGFGPPRQGGANKQEPPAD
ncbi:MAG: sodium:proton antiporter [Gammaproteobacteria bacterium]